MEITSLMVLPLAGELVCVPINLCLPSVYGFAPRGPACHLGHTSRHSCKWCAHRLCPRADTSRPRPSCTGATDRPLHFLSSQWRQRILHRWPCVSLWLSYRVPTLVLTRGRALLFFPRLTSVNRLNKVDFPPIVHWASSYQLKGLPPSWLISVENPESSRL